MSIFKRSTSPPPRRAHPDPRVEVQLQRIISLRRAAQRNEDQLDEFQQELGHANRTAARNPGGSDTKRYRLREIDRLNEEITRLNRETADLHDQIGALCDKLTADDLLWLDPAAAS